MLNKIFFCAALFLGFSQTFAQQDTTVQALEEVVLIDSKFKLKRENSGKVVTKITAKELQNHLGQSLPEVLNSVSGIEISGARSSQGQNLGYYVRGGRNRQVVILVDGVQLNDPSAISNDFDLRLLSLNQIESIEIIKGAASTLYGSGAATAVISITTKGPSEEMIAFHAESVLGTNQDQQNQDYDIANFQNGVGVSGKISKLDYQLDFSQRYSRNISAVKSSVKDEDFQEDPFSKYNVYTRIGYRINSRLQFYLYANLDDFNSSFDDSFLLTDANNSLKSRQVRTGSHWQGTYKNGSFSFDDSYTELHREIQSGYPAKYNGKQYSFDANNKYTFKKKLHTVLGLNGNFSSFNSYDSFEGSFQESTNDSIANFNMLDPYLNIVYLSHKGFHLNTGARLDIHSQYGTHWVYNINPSYSYSLQNGYIKALASYSTAYITPSLYQLFVTSYGNEELQPEESATLETGLEFKNEELRISSVFFRRTTKNFIDFVTVDPVNYVSQYRNIPDKFVAEGVEVEADWEINNRLSLNSNYTFTQAAERFALRIPKHKLNAKLNFQWDKRTFSSLSYQFTSKRTDSYYDSTTFKTRNVELAGYGITDFYMNRELNERMKIFVGISNIFNENYQELYHFSTRGRNFRIGFLLNL